MASGGLPAGGMDNVILCSDSYKVTHHMQYPPNTTIVYSYFESRGGKFDQTVFFGLQYIIKRWLVGQVVTREKIAEAKAIFALHFGNAKLFNESGWQYIVDKHAGRLPVRIKAVPEGTVIPYKNVLLTVENTDPQCFWLTNFLETLIVQVWYPMTVATNSYYQKEIIAEYLNETADNLDSLPFKLHDFGFRGTSSVESAGIGGAAHLVNFQGTDTLAGIMTARRYYGCTMAGSSVPAAEHSTITTWGRAGEEAAFRNMLEKFPSGIVSVVSDSYDVWAACSTLWGTNLHDLVVSRGPKGAVLVVRPDSGDPATVVIKVLDILGSKFGSTVNSKGFKMLPSYIRMIQGDGISYETLREVLSSVKRSGWSAENVVFGSGGALLQRLDRDTQKCAYKCSYAVIDGQPVNVYKEPVTDVGKKSKKGRLLLEKNGDVYSTREAVNKATAIKDELVTVFENGVLTREYSFDEIRRNAQIPLLRGGK